MQPYDKDILADERNKAYREISNNCMTASLESSHVVVKNSSSFSTSQVSTEFEKCIPGALLEYLLILIVIRLGNKNCHRFR